MEVDFETMYRQWQYLMALALTSHKRKFLKVFMEKSTEE